MRFLEQSPTATTNQFSLGIVLVLDQVVTRWGDLLFSIWGAATNRNTFHSQWRSTTNWGNSYSTRCWLRRIRSRIRGMNGWLLRWCSWNEEEREMLMCLHRDKCRDFQDHLNECFPEESGRKGRGKETKTQYHVVLEAFGNAIDNGTNGKLTKWASKQQRDNRIWTMDYISNVNDELFRVLPLLPYSAISTTPPPHSPRF